jgi:uncharacterized protein with ATP-grasp and redox domains
MMNQAWNTARIVTEDDHHFREILRRTAQVIHQTDLELSPAENSLPVYDIVAQVTGVQDPYHELKRQSNEEALTMLPELRRTIDRAEDRIGTALHVAVAGNIIDLGIGHAYDLKKDVEVIRQLL